MAKRKKTPAPVEKAPPEHLLVDLRVTSGLCACGAQFEISSTAADGLSPAHCQDALLDMYHQHRDDENKPQPPHHQT